LRLPISGRRHSILICNLS